jgi:hypothetical protein
MAKKISGIYVEIKGDSTQLKKEIREAKQYVTEQSHGISNALNNALSPGQIKSGVNTIVESLKTLSRGASVVKENFNLVSVDLKNLQHLTGITGEAFEKLQQRMLVTKAADVQEKALKSIAQAANLSRKEIAEMGAQFNLSVDQIDKVATALHDAEAKVKSLSERIAAMPPIKNYTTLAESASKSLSGQANSQVEKLSRDFVTLAENAGIAHKAFSLIGIDLDALAVKTGLTSEQMADLNARFAAEEVRSSQVKALKDIAAAAVLTREEIKSMGQQFGLTVEQIKAVTTALHGEEIAIKSLSERIAAMPPIKNYTTLASSATSSLSAQSGAGLEKFNRDLVAMANGAEIASKSFKLLDIDIAALSATTGLTGEQIGVLGTKIANIQGEKAKTAALKSMAEAAGLSRKEIAELGAQMGVSSANIEKVTKEIHGAVAALKNYTTLAATASSALNIQMGAGVEKFAKDLVALASGANASKKSFEMLKIDIDALRAITGLTAEQFNVLKTKVANVQAETTQADALQSIATSAGLSRKEIAALGQQMGASAAVIHNVTTAIHGAEAAMSSLALQANAGIFSGFQSGVTAFSTDIISLANGSKLAHAAMDSLKADMDILGKTAGFTAEQITALKTRFSTNQAEEAQAASLTNIANSLRLSRSEIAAFGQQMGASSTVIHNVTTAIHGAEAAMSSLALQANAGIFSGFKSQASAFATDIISLANGAKLAQAAMDSLKIDMDALSATTGLTAEQITTLKTRFSANQAENAQAASLTNIANSLKLSRSEIAAFGQQMGASTAVIHNVTIAVHGAEAAMSSLALKANAGIFSGFQSQAAAFSTDIIKLVNGSKLAETAMASLKTDMDSLGVTTGLTAEQISTLKTRFSSNQAEEAQSAALTNIANSLRLSRTEIATFGQQMGVSTAVIHNVTAAIHGAEAAISSLTLKANAGIFSGFQSQAAAFSTDIIGLANGTKLAKTAMDSLKTDMDALSKTTGLTAEQVATLKTRFSDNQAENAQSAALTNIANSLRLSRAEIAAFGQQMGVSSAVIHNVTAAIHGAEAAISSLALKANAGIFSGFQAQAGDFSANIAGLANGSKLAGAAMNSLTADMEVVRKQSGLTTAQFAKLKGQFIRVQGEKAQETALKNIAISAGLAEKELRQLGRQMGLSQISINRVAAETNSLGRATEFSMMKFKDMIITVGIYTFAFAALTATIKGLKQGIFDFNAQIEVSQLGIASAFLSAGKYIDEQTGKILEGEAAFRTAQIEARSIIEELKAANLSTIATLDQLVRAYQETLPVAMRAGFDKSQVQEFTTAMIQVAGAIDASGALMHQLGEETRSLLNATINPRTSRIAVVLGITNEDVRKFKNDADGMFNFLMDKLSAYRVAGVELQNTWKGLASNTIDVVTQMTAMIGEPLFEAVKADLKTILDSIVVIDEKTKQMKWSDDFMEGIESIKRGLGEVIASFRYLGIFIDAAGYSLADLAAKLSFSDESKETFQGWAENFLKRAQEGDRKLQELYNRMEGLNSDGSKIETSPSAKFVPSKGDDESDKDHANDYNSMLRARLDYLRAEEEKGLTLVRAANKLMQQENEHAYDLGLTSYKEYLAQKNKLTENQLKANLEASKQKLQEAEEALALIKPVTDKDGDARPEKDQKNYYDALKKVENAEKEVLEKANELRVAQSDGAHEATMATIENLRAYQDLNIQLLEMRGQYEEAAKAREVYAHGSVEYLSLQEAANRLDEDGLLAREKMSVLDEIRLHRDKAFALNRAKDAKHAELALAEMNGEYQKELEIKKQILDIEIKLAELHGDDPKIIEYLKAMRAELEKMGTAAGAFAVSWQKATQDWANATRRMENLAYDTANAMHDSFEDLFFDALQGDMKSFMDYFKSFLSSLNRALAKFWADWLVGSMTHSSSGGSGGWLTTLVNLFSSGASASSGSGWTGTGKPSVAVDGWHTGGVPGVDRSTMSRTVPAEIFDNAPRFHKGLMPDEYPAILQKGEGVFTPGQMAALGDWMIRYRNGYASGTMDQAGSSITINVPVTAEDRSRQWTRDLKHEIEDVVERYMRRQLA